MRVLLAVLWVVVGQSIPLAQQMDTIRSAQVDEYVDHLALDSQLTLEQRTKLLTKPWRSEIEKFRSIFRYVTTTIVYDDEAFKNGRRRINRSSDDILRRKKAVCWGYSELLREMCAKVEIACLVVSGYARDAPAPGTAYEKSNHAWNAVRIDGRWFLSDATWAAGTLDGENHFTRVDDIDYFLADPSLLIHSHFPLMKMWQLLHCPVTYQAFLDFNFERDPKQLCDFNFGAHIDYFLAQNHLDQQVAILREAHDVNPTHSNKQQVGHALIDVAIHRKELGDHHFEQDSISHAIEEFEAALRIFSVAVAMVELYPWQIKARLFTQANLAQAMHRQEAKNFRSREEVRQALKILSDMLEDPDVTIEGQLRSQLQELVDTLLL